MATSIWQDYPITLGATDPYYFRVRTDTSSGPIIYTGAAHTKPGAASTIVNVNDICADYLAHDFPTSSGFHAENWARTFYVQKSTNNSTWTAATNITFCDCWDYTNSSVGTTFDFPIKRLPSWAWYPITTDASGTLKLYRYPNANGKGTSSAQSLTATGPGTCWFTAVSSTKSFRPYGTTYPYVNIDDCIQAVLYYVTPFGGWSVIPIEGAVVPGDDVDRLTYKPEYSNTSALALGEKTLVNTITQRWTLHTAPLTKTEAAGMRRVFRSPLLYLAIYGEATVPVILQDASLDYVSRGAGSASMPSYTFNVRLAQDRIAR